MARLGKATNEALAEFQRFRTLVDTSAHAHADVGPIYTRSIAAARDETIELSRRPAVVEALARTILANRMSDRSVADKDPLFRLATHFLSTPSLERGLAGDKTEEAWKQRIAGGLFLSQSLRNVAGELVETTVTVGSRIAQIDAARPQDSRHNVRFEKRPIFGPERADAYVPNFMGNRMLFLRADAPETLSCVCVMQATIDNERVTKQGKIGEALGLPDSSIADVLLSDEGLVLSAIRPRP